MSLETIQQQLCVVESIFRNQEIVGFDFLKQKKNVLCL